MTVSRSTKLDHTFTDQGQQRWATAGSAGDEEDEALARVAARRGAGALRLRRHGAHRGRVETGCGNARARHVHLHFLYMMETRS